MSTATTDTQPISLTPGAAEELKRLKKEQQLPEEIGLRLGVKGGGCSGLSYVLGFDEKKPEDEEYRIAGIRVFMQAAHAIYLTGMEIDYHEGLDNRGFIFNNPNASETCGCGSSFA